MNTIKPVIKTINSGISERPPLSAPSIQPQKKSTNASFEGCFADAKKDYTNPDERFNKFSSVLDKAQDLGVNFSVKAFIRECFSREKDPQTIEDLIEIAKADANQIHYILEYLEEISVAMKNDIEPEISVSEEKDEEINR